MEYYEVYTDGELSQKLSQGDRKAYVTIYDRYYSLLYLYAFKKLGNREEAKDIIQEIFISLWEKHREITFDVSLSSYLYRSVRNRALNIFAHREVEKKYLDSLQDFLVQHHQSADYLVRENDIAELIAREIENLPPSMRKIFLLSRNEHLSYKQIAEALNISEETVRTQMKRALKTLRVKLGVFVYWFVFI
ncbi:RNA polymerase sigma-70 factor [Pedobacter vanadiisoli]|uniref:RNA polymerase sigma-70 factor n=1 Tax=Pedobacter vanadiisoli TaxID=1761975 RepID=A0ABW5MGW9_9SPHI